MRLSIDDYSGYIHMDQRGFPSPDSFSMNVHQVFAKVFLAHIARRLGNIALTFHNVWNGVVTATNPVETRYTAELSLRFLPSVGSQVEFSYVVREHHFSLDFISVKIVYIC